MNSIGSKVVIRPLAETFEISAKKDLQLQRTVVWQDLPSASPDAMEPGDLPESNEEAVAVDSPPGEMAVEAAADVPEDLPSGKRSRTEAKEEDVEMYELEEEEPPQDDSNDAQMPAPEEEAPDFGGDVDLDDDVSETNSQKMQRANRLLNSGILERFANSSDEEDGAPQLGPIPRIANPVMATFISQMMSEDREFLDALIQAEEERRQRRHEEGVLFTEVQPKEEVRYGEELEERKAQDIFSHTSTREFMEALKPETDENLSSAQSSLEHHLFAGRQNYQRLHSNKMSLLDPLEPEQKIKIEIPKPQPTEDPMTVEPEYDCALDKLGQLSKHHKNKNFGFYGKYFRESHARSMNFFKYRRPHPVGHPHFLFDFDEEKFMDTYVQLFYTTPTLEDYFLSETCCLWL